MLAVVEPQMTGIGGDCFVLFAPAGAAPMALNGSGFAAATATPDWFASQGIDTIVDDSPHAVTVPGAIDAWCRLHADHGALDFARLLAPAIQAAEDGYRVAPRVALDWSNNQQRLARHPETEALFLPGGRAPLAGDRHAQPQLAKTLRRIAREGRAGFYQGEVAEHMVAALRNAGSLLTLDDFAAYASRYETPISAPFLGRDVFECPPNGQGVAALALLRLLEDWSPYADATDEALRIHLFAEATKRAYSVRDALVGDPHHGPVPVQDILSDHWRDHMRASIDPARVTVGPALPRPLSSDTVCFSVVDAVGNTVSFINSIFLGFGSTRLDAQTGVLFHCRGMAFSVKPDHPNSIAPHKRPMHTIIPGLVMNKQLTELSFGVMGGQYQAAGHAHLLIEHFWRGHDLQSAIDLPRHFAHEDSLTLEGGIDDTIAARLSALGHRVIRAPAPLGGAQAIHIDRVRGLLTGASDGRKDGCVLAF